MSAQSKTFSCTYCGKKFTRKENLNRHLKTHNTQRTHRCSVCDRGFTRSDLLRRHESLHGSPGSAPIDDPSKDSERAANGEPLLKRTRFAYPNHEELAPEPSGFQREISHAETLRESTLIAMTNGVEQYPHHESMSSAGHRNYASSSVTDISNIPQGPTQQGLTPQDPYFDFSTFALPSEYGLPEGSDHWFSLDFYSALQETDWEQMLGLGDQPLSTLPEGVDNGVYADSSLQDNSQILQSREVNCNDGEQHNDKVDEEGVEDENHTIGRISRLSSPPNEASLEDRTPFAWNPRSRRIAEAKEIILSSQDPLLRFHNPRYDLAASTYQRVKKFLVPHGHTILSSVQDSFTLPALPITNAFIAKFFQRFAPQAPVLHCPTLNTNADLPPALLAIMIVIGAIYSRLRHTRRFAILALDRVRRNLLLAIEDDNTLMRDHMTIYAVALVCYTGLWCGNKRAFELAEILRGAMITYVRRIGGAEPSHQSSLSSQTNVPSMTDPTKSLQSETMKTQWHQWIIQESRKRLFWFVYTIDCHFPSLLNMPPLMSPTEVSGWDCPGDEEFWVSKSARHWKSLLGSASMPPSRSFAAAFAPFTSTCKTCPNSDKDRSRCSPDCQTPPLNLNAWSYFLVILTLQGRIFQHAEERLLARKIAFATSHCDFSDEEDSDSPNNHANTPSRQEHPLASALTLWASTYTAQLPPPHQSDPTSLYFHHASAVLSRLSRIHLDVPITDLQEAIGKGGNAMIQPATSRLANWVALDPTRAQTAVVEAVDTIQRILWFQQTRARKTDGSGGGGDGLDTSPYNSIALFLSYVLLWAFATVATAEQKHEVADLLAGRGEEFRSRSLQRVVRVALGVPAEPHERAGNTASVGEESPGPKVLFKHAAQVLTRLGDWGCSLNLALLLHWRSEM